MAIPEPWVPEPDTAYIRYDEHVAKLAEIRAAVEAERESTFRHVTSRGKDKAPAFTAALRARAALEALLEVAP